MENRKKKSLDNDKSFIGVKQLGKLELLSLMVIFLTLLIQKSCGISSQSQ